MSGNDNHPAPWRWEGDKLRDAKGELVLYAVFDGHAGEAWLEAPVGVRALIAAAPEMLELMARIVEAGRTGESAVSLPLEREIAALLARIVVDGAA